MNNLIPGISFSISSLSDFSNRSVAEQLVRDICDVPSCIKPRRFGPFVGESLLDGLEEPIKYLVPTEKEASTGTLVLTVSKNCEFQIQWSRSEPPSFPFVSGFLLRHLLNSQPAALKAFFDLIKKLSLAVNVVYGDIRSMEFSGWDTPFNLKLRLPEVPNISIYGKQYIDFFGRKTIETAPFHRIEQLSENVYWLEATPHVTDAVPEEVRISLRKHLGEEAFMAGKKWRYASGMQPAFDFGEVRSSVSPD